jgi:hypothetical protein
MNGYVCFYKGKRWECHAPSLLDAKLKALENFRVHRSRGYLVSVVLAEKNGEPVVHSGAEL